MCMLLLDFFINIKSVDSCDCCFCVCVNFVSVVSVGVLDVEVL